MSLLKRISVLISSFFYVGYLPLVPGTFGSLAGLLVYYFIYSNTVIFIFVTFFITAAGFLFSGRAERALNKKDSRHIVIDEVSGMLISLLFLPFNATTVILAFFIFRLLDTLKPYPADRLQKLNGSAGIMSDDIVAGLYTNIVLQLGLRLASLRIS